MPTPTGPGRRIQLVVCVGLRVPGNEMASKSSGSHPAMGGLQPTLVAGAGLARTSLRYAPPRPLIKQHLDYGRYGLADQGPGGPHRRSMSPPLPSAPSSGLTKVSTPCTTSAKVAGAPSIWLRLRNVAHIIWRD